jgi:hypothetical protein
MQLGDLIERALSAVGLTHDRVTRLTYKEDISCG